MGVKQMISKVGNRAGNRVAKLAKLSPDQLQEVEDKREKYLTEMPDPTDTTATALTEKLLAANSVEIYNAYLPQIEKLYVPVAETAEYDGEQFDDGHNIRYFRITKWVTDKKENSLEKLINVYEVLSNEECNIALVFHRGVKGTEVYLAVTNTKNSKDNNDVNSYKNRIEDAIKGNFPGTEWTDDGKGVIPCLNNKLKYSVASATNIPTEKSEKFISQTIEKLLDGIVPSNKSNEYTIILLATPIQDVDARKLRLEEIYSGLAPYAGWQTSFTYNESSSIGSSATVGVNVGASAGVQNGQNSSVTNSEGQTDSSGQTISDSTGSSETNTSGQSTTDTQGNSTTDTTGESSGTSSGSTETSGTNYSEGTSEGTSGGSSHTEGSSKGSSDNAGASFIGQYSHNWQRGTSTSDMTSDGWSKGSNTSHGTSESTAKTLTETATKTASKAITETASKAISNSTSKAIANTVGRTVANTLGKAVTKTAAVTSGVFKATNLGINFGANFARSSNVTAMVGKNEGIIQTFTNYNVKHTLELLEDQMKRYEESSALGMWDFAAYVLSENPDIANNVAHSYIALTEGTKSYMSRTAVNLWRGDIEDNGNALEICTYLRELRHPVFGLNPQITEQDDSFNVYPAIVTATTALTGKELAYSLNFPKKSVVGLPVLECAEFGRNVVKYGNSSSDSAQIHLGHIFHMNHEERTDVDLTGKSLASHTFVTGSTGSGKSNTVYQMLDEAKEEGIKFLVIEPAKGEYKDVFGNDNDVSVYGTNPDLSTLLRINPFSFPKGIHVFEHMDRLVEIFNVCWPMYAAMPAVLKSAIEQSYADCGWDLTNSVNPYGENLYPNFSDVARNIRAIIDSSEYDTENKGAYKGSLLTRLKSLTNGINGMIFSEDAVPDEQLFDKNVIIDLSRVGSSETKSLLMGMLVLKLQEHRMTDVVEMNGDLRHLTVLEEAHNLLKRTSTEQPVEGGNLLGKSVEMLSNAIAEMRTYGEGFIIVDQAPGLLDMSAIRNTNTKIIMRLPDQIDRELVGKSANLNNEQITELAKLPCGVAAVYQNEWVQPVLCKIEYFDTKGSKYYYARPDENRNAPQSDDAIQIAEILSKGMKLDKESILRDIQPKLEAIGMDSSSKVTIYKMLLDPPKEPRMTKLAPIMSKLFPEASASMKNAYNETSDASAWTKEVEEQLRRTVKIQIDDRVRKDIVQCIITDYLINEINNDADFQKWGIEGGLR